MYKVFINNRELIITSQLPDNIPEDSLIIKEFSEYGFKEKLEHFISNNYLNTFCIIDRNPSNSWHLLQKNTHYIVAAGGLVLNPLNELLFIFRYGKWDFPKGKKEPEESPELTAKREVVEECGINDLEIIKPLSPTYHMYNPEYDIWVLKKTYWFLMRAKEWENPVPQVEEGISEVIWSKKSDLYKYLSNTYPSIKILTEEFVDY